MRYVVPVTNVATHAAEVYAAVTTFFKTKGQQTPFTLAKISKLDMVHNRVNWLCQNSTFLMSTFCKIHHNNSYNRNSPLFIVTFGDLSFLDGYSSLYLFVKSPTATEHITAMMIKSRRKVARTDVTATNTMFFVFSPASDVRKWEVTQDTAF